MPYIATVWQDGVTPLTQNNLNHLESQYLEATKSNNADLLAPYVMSGLAVTRHNSYAAAVLTDTPLRYYRLDEASGTTAFDSSGNAQTAAITGGVTLGATGALTGDPDAAMTFNGTSGYITGNLNTGLPTGNAAISLELWMKISSAPASQQEVCSYGANGTHNYIQLDLDTGGHVLADAGGAGTVTSGVLSTGVWHHVVMTWDGTTLRLYVDGSSVGTPATPAAQTIPTSSTFLRIGANASGTAGQFFGGSVDEFAVYSGALSSTRVTAHYNAGTTATTQVDMTSGTVYPAQSDSTTRQRVISSASFTTVTPSTTYYLYAQPDGTTYWNTANTPAANSLAIAQVTTDGSGNVSLVTDKRTLATTLLPNATGQIKTPGLASVGGQATAGAFGAPVIVAQSLRNSITNTTQQTILTVTLPANGTYRVSATLYIGNTTTNQTPTLKTSFTNCKGSADFVFLTGLLNNGSAVVGLDGFHDAFPSSQATVNVAPVTAEMNAGTLTVTYTAPGTPNDVVSVIVERLA